MKQIEKVEIKGMKHFKLRAECFDDVILLIKKLPTCWGIKIEQWDILPDVEFEFKTSLTSDEIIAILMKQDDSHTMIDTLKPIDEYSGERTS